MKSCPYAVSSDDPVEKLVLFGRALRAAGLPVGPDRVASFSRAAALLPPGELYWAGRATLLSRPEQIDIYDALFTLSSGRRRPRWALRFGSASSWRPRRTPGSRARSSS